MNPIRKRIEQVAFDCGFGVWRGNRLRVSPERGKSAINVTIAQDPLLTWKLIVGVDHAIPEHRRVELRFEAGRKLEKALEATKGDGTSSFAGFKVERGKSEDPMTWDGRLLDVNVLIDLKWLVPQDAFAFKQGV